MYDPQIARFLQEDTYTGDAEDPLSLNLYTYCRNEPLMYTDPSGNVEVASILKDKTLMHFGLLDYEVKFYVY